MAAIIAAVGAGARAGPKPRKPDRRQAFVHVGGRISESARHFLGGRIRTERPMRMRRFLPIIALLTLAGCASAQMQLPTNLASASRTEFNGIGGWAKGKYTAGAWSGRYERSATQLSYLIPLVENRGHSEFTLERVGSDRLEGNCRMRENSVDLGLVEVTTRPMAYRCEFERGFLELQEVNGGHINRYERRGRIAFDGEAVEIRSVHHLAGTSMPVSSPIGYVFEQNGRPVGAVELNGKPVLMIEPGASPQLEQTLTLAALALGVFWDPANITDS
jgi:hypothetical protein